MIDRADTFSRQTDLFPERDESSAQCALPGAGGLQGTALRAGTALVADDSSRVDCVLQELPRLTLKVNGKHRNRWLSGARHSCLPAEVHDSRHDSDRMPTVPKRSFQKLTLPTRDVQRADKWAVTAAVGAFLRNREIGLLDFTQCDPASEVLHNLFGTEVSEANPYVSGPIKEMAKCVKFPRGMQSVPSWIELLWELDEMTLEDYQGECIDINNRYLRQLNVSGPRLRDVHVAETTVVHCREPGVRIHQGGEPR